MTYVEKEDEENCNHHSTNYNYYYYNFGCDIVVAGGAFNLKIYC
jgi:hypothetical protein